MNKDIIKYAVLGVGAWYVWKTYMSKPATTVVSGTTVTPPPATTVVVNPPAPVPPPPTAPPPVNTANIRSKVVAAAGGKTSGFNFDQWNYYLTAAYPGTTPPAPEDVGITRTDPMPQITVDQYVSAITTWASGHGVAGLGPWALGDLAELGLWTSNRVPQPGWAGVERNPHFVWRT